MQYKEFKGSYADLTTQLRTLQGILQKVQQVQMNIDYVRTCLNVLVSRGNYASLASMSLEHVASQVFLDNRAFSESVADATYKFNIEVIPVDHNTHLLKPSTANTAFLDVWDNLYTDYEGNPHADFDMTAPFTSIITVMDTCLELQHHPYLFDTYSASLSPAYGLDETLLYEDISNPLSHWWCAA